MPLSEGREAFAIIMERGEQFGEIVLVP